ncbi:MAG: hypothetical protein KGR98_04185 [Verrucomicrobia bacterium]|nr:hypothetical protein [Verrucomicrobiota bacterium]
MKKLKSFTGWSVVFLAGTVLWVIFEQNRNLLNGEGTAAMSLPIIIAVSIMAYYERRIRSLSHSNAPEIMIAGKDEKARPN